MDTDFSKVYKKIYGSSYNSKHHKIFPNHIRMIIAGSSGSGKTNLLMNFIMKNYIHYDNIMIYTTTSYQEAYRFLRDINTEMKRQTTKDIATFHSPDDGIADPSELDNNKTHVLIFDDAMNEGQKVMTDYFTRGRHNNVNVFYLCQSLHQLKKHGIRQNANIFILFQQDKKTLKYFHDTHISGDMPFEEFEKICEDAWNKKHGYIVVNLWEDSECGRYLLNYERMYTPEKYTPEKYRQIHNNT